MVTWTTVLIFIFCLLWNTQKKIKRRYSEWLFWTNTILPKPICKGSEGIEAPWAHFEVIHIEQTAVPRTMRHKQRLPVMPTRRHPFYGGTSGGTYFTYGLERQATQNICTTTKYGTQSKCHSGKKKGGMTTAEKVWAKREPHTCAQW